jgi:hypothetical protein
MDAFRSLGRGDWIVSRACQERCSRVRRWHAIRGLLFPRIALAHFKVGAVFTDDHDWHTPDLDCAWRRTATCVRTGYCARGLVVLPRGHTAASFASPPSGASPVPRTASSSGQLRPEPISLIAAWRTPPSALSACAVAAGQWLCCSGADRHERDAVRPIRALLSLALVHAARRWLLSLGRGLHGRRVHPPTLSELLPSLVRAARPL